MSAVASATFQLAAAAPPMTTFAPKSDFAEWIQALYLQVIGWDSAILLLVTVLLILALAFFSTRVNTETAPPVSDESRGLEVAWTIGPALVLLAIAIPTVRTTFRAQPRAEPPNAVRVEVTAHQWWWQVEYPDWQIRTANELHLPAGRAAWIRLQSADIIHSFWVPQLGGKRDIIPGHTNVLTLVPKVPGTYVGQCAEFCGLSHANMRFRVFIDPPARFDAWVARQQMPAAIPVHASDALPRAAQGARLFAASPCVTCHAVSGVATQKVGPDLTHFGSRTTLAAAVLENNPTNLAAWLRDPQRIKPGAQMPNLGLTEQEIAQLVAYLESLK